MQFLLLSAVADVTEMVTTRSCSWVPVLLIKRLLNVEFSDTLCEASKRLKLNLITVD